MCLVLLPFSPKAHNCAFDFKDIITSDPNPSNATIYEECSVSYDIVFWGSLSAPHPIIDSS